MSLLGKIGAAVGAGAADVSVTLPQDRYEWNETIRGKILLQRGQVDQTASEVRVSILEEWVTVDSENRREHHQRRHNETVVARDVAIAAGSSQELEFEIPAPEQGWVDHDWSVAVRVAVPRAKDRHGKTGFTLLHPAAIRGLAAALGEIGPFQRKTHSNKGNEVQMDFAPPKELKNRLDGVRLLVRQEGDTVTGILEINPQEHSLQDHLKALLKRDRIQHEIRFPVAPLAASPDGPAPADVVARLNALLAPHLG